MLADGSFVTANKDQHADLFWALRGGGGNFGVVTSFLFQAHPSDGVRGTRFWEATNARTVMRAYRDFMASAPEELGIFVGLKTVPSLDPFPRDYWGGRAVAIIGSYNGGRLKGRRRWAAAGLTAYRFSTGWVRCRFRPCRVCSTRFFRKVCSGTGKVIS